jgi:hypothetical protein
MLSSRVLPQAMAPGKAKAERGVAPPQHGARISWRHLSHSVLNSYVSNSLSISINLLRWNSKCRCALDLPAEGYCWHRLRFSLFIIGGSSTSAFADSCAITRTGPGSAATVSNPSGAHGQLHQYPKQLHRYRQCQQCRQHQRERQYRPDQNGITIDNSSVGGAISNSGTITASNIGIAVGTSEFVANTATVSGGITNGGTTSITGRR